MTAEGNAANDGLREAVVGALLQFDISPHDAPGMATAVLALPELATLRAKADAADRVRELAEEYDEIVAIGERAAASEGKPYRRQEMLDMAAEARITADRIRRALDGDPC